MIDKPWLARAINNILQGARFDPVDMAMVAQFQMADAKARQLAGEQIVAIKESLNLGIPETHRLVPRHTQPENRNGETAQG